MLNKTKEEAKNRYYFEKFRKDCRLLDGTPGPKYGDKPDVILEGKRKIGIEITNFYLEDGNLATSEQHQRKRREQVVSEAQRIYQTGNGKKFRMSFSFNKTNPILDEKKLVEKIVEIARDFGKYLETGQSRKFILAGSENTFEAIRDYYNIPELFNVSIDFLDAEWGDTTVHSIELTSMEKLKKIIRKKECKLREYERCDAYWLLVIVDWADLAQDQETRIDGFEKIDSESFEKIFVYKPQFGHILEVK